MRILVLGGTSEATALAALLARRRDLDAVLSYAGRTAELKRQPIPTRVGGFGGVDGLAAYLAETAVDVLVDATHPFAEQMSRHAAEAADRTGVPLVALTRAPWTPIPGDRWTEVESLEAAAEAIGAKPRRVLLTVGRLGLKAFEAAPQHHYLVRSIDPPEGLALPNARVILDRPPFDAGAEEALMRAERIEVLVTKNSGGKATSGKLAAARALGLPVVIVRPPARADVPTVRDPAAALRFIDAAGKARAGGPALAADEGGAAHPASPDDGEKGAERGV
ncbi:cobalt-precorrin-6A reductase [Chthonobacter rhizosphaerae]|uniref:cobalt-precorrin-6A reductase n=1 Tax=Chthonobacter rhizosphaerae TaxID=2735553 RepID=UPI0015EFA46B|nr:cobalt-precorrin-6A reductase [Chthonobacter rhizosphaerae]